MDFIISKHIFSNRIYILDNESKKKSREIQEIAQETEEEIKEGIRANIFGSGKELQGAGVCCYGKVIGSLLSWMGFACKIKISGREIYVNNRSFTKFIIRSAELKVEIDKEMFSPSSTSDIAKKLNDLYKSHFKSGYDRKSLFHINTEFKKLNQDSKNTFEQMVKKLQKIAVSDMRSRATAQKKNK